MSEKQEELLVKLEQLLANIPEEKQPEELPKIAFAIDFLNFMYTANKDKVSS